MYARMEGEINKAEALSAVNKLGPAIEQLKPGFVIINDISGFQATNEENFRLLSRLLDAFIEKGVQKIFRVVGPSKHSLMTFASFDKTAAKVPVEYVPTMEEAEKKLKALRHLEEAKYKEEAKLKEESVA